MTKNMLDSILYFLYYLGMRLKNYTRIQIEIRDEKLHIRAKMRAAYEQMDLWELVERALRNELSKPKKDK